MTYTEVTEVIDYFIDIVRSLFNVFMGSWITSMLFLTALAMFIVNSFIAPTGLSTKGRDYVEKHKGSNK